MRPPRTRGIGKREGEGSEGPPKQKISRFGDNNPHKRKIDIYYVYSIYIDYRLGAFATTRGLEQRFG